MRALIVFYGAMLLIQAASAVWLWWRLRKGVMERRRRWRENAERASAENKGRYEAAAGMLRGGGSE